MGWRKQLVNRLSNGVDYLGSGNKHHEIKLPGGTHDSGNTGDLRT